MGLRDKLKESVRSVIDRFSGEFSAGSGEIRPDDAPVSAAPADGKEVQVTRARLKRPLDAKEAAAGAKEQG